MEQPENQEHHFSYKLLRYTLLPALLGHDEGDILYWGGKTIARKYPIDQLEDMVTFFKEAGWGELRIVKEKRKAIYFEMKLHSSETEEQAARQLEAGYIAEQIEHLKGKTAFTYITEGKNKITFQVQWE